MQNDVCLVLVLDGSCAYRGEREREKNLSKTG